MILERGRLLAAGVSLAVVITGCGITGSAPTATPDPATATSPAPLPTRRPHRTPRVVESAVPSLAPADGGPATPLPTPLRTRRPRPTPSADPSSVPAVTPPPGPPATPMPPIPGFDAIAGSDGRFTLLLLGSDARGKLAGERTDTIMLVTIDPTSGKVAMVSLPRDTVNVPIGPGETFASPNRINALLEHYEFGGSSRTQALKQVERAMEYAFGVEIDAYAIVGFLGVTRLIDAIGGVDVTLARPLWDRSMHVAKKGLKLKAGVNHLDGKLALAFARTRHTDSDYQRAGRQQQLILAATQKVLANGASAIPALADFALRNVVTDLPVSALPVLVELANRARLARAKQIVLSPPTYEDAADIIYTTELKLDTVRALMTKLFAPVR